jgi:polyisoprenoid-binding protein YceI
MARLLLFLLLLLVPAPAKADQAQYYIPPQQFNAAIQIMDLGFANVLGIFRNAVGSFEFEETTKSVGKLRFALDASSLITSTPGSASELMGPSMLDARRYSEISFSAPKSISFVEGKAKIDGTLTVRGVPKPMTFEATLNRVGKSPAAGGVWNREGDAVGLSMRGSFKRADFGMSDENDPNRYGDDVTLLLETQAIKQ